MIDLILTYNSQPQENMRKEFILEKFTDKVTFLNYVMEDLNNAEKEDLLKISTCVYIDEPIDPPDWYTECNGKFFEEDWIDLI